MAKAMDAIPLWDVERPEIDTVRVDLQEQVAGLVVVARGMEVYDAVSGASTHGRAPRLRASLGPSTSPNGPANFTLMQCMTIILHME